MRVLGVDPGLARTGYAVVEDAGASLVGLTLGVIKTNRVDPLPWRLLNLEEALVRIVEEWEPDCLSVERLYFQVNTKSAIQVGEAAGVVLLVAGRFGLEAFGYSPNEVKRSLTGYGGADKAQMTAMTSRLLGVSPSQLEPDAADAAAVAVTHLNNAKVQAAVRRAL